MKIYLDPKHKWGVVLENDNGKKHYIVIPPTDGDRIDFITYQKPITGYNYRFVGIIITIENGVPKLTHNIK